MPESSPVSLSKLAVLPLPTGGLAMICILTTVLKSTQVVCNGLLPFSITSTVPLIPQAIGTLFTPRRLLLNPSYVHVNGPPITISASEVTRYTKLVGISIFIAQLLVGATQVRSLVLMAHWISNFT